MINSLVAEETNAKLNFSIELEKDRQVYCFIGENGIGKTQLLETIARCCLYTHSLFVNQSDEYNKIYLLDGIYNHLKERKLFLPKSIKMNGIEVKKKETENWGVADFQSILNKNRNLVIKKPILFIGAKNRGFAKNVDSEKLEILGGRAQRFLRAFDKTLNYMHSQEVDEKSVVEWFITRLIINPDFVSHQDNFKEDVVLLCKLLKEFEPVKLKDLVVENPNRKISLNIVYNEGKLLFSGVPFDKLPTGYISIIKIFQDIIDGYSSWNFQNLSPIQETEGLVFIDEIESHLHPKWERSILPLLRKHFPKTTFYVTTHSPLIISTTLEGEGYELIAKDNWIFAENLGNPKNWYLADIYSQCFHVGYSQDLLDTVERVLDLSSKLTFLVKNYTKQKDIQSKQKAEGILAELNSLLPESDPRRESINHLGKLLEV